MRQMSNWYPEGTTEYLIADSCPALSSNDQDAMFEQLYEIRDLMERS